jgi:hypothetical protein
MTPETLLRYALGEERRGHRPDDPSSAVPAARAGQEANFAPEAVTEIVVMVERSFTRHGGPLAPAGADRPN